LSVVSKIVYSGVDFVIGGFLLFLAPRVGDSDIMAIWLIGIGIMTVLKATLPPDMMLSKVFYGGTDLMIGLFMLSSAQTLGEPAATFGGVLLARAGATAAGLIID
jgi:hypothetical protein